jgi:hypothetical protein
MELYRAGDPERALAIAKDAADTNSFAGLDLYASLLDLEGQTREAESWYRRASDRYSEPAELLAFLMRHQAQNASYARELPGVMAKVFPHGLEHGGAATLTGAPDAGMRIRTAGLRGQHDGLRDSDVIVAVDGIRIRDMHQYAAVKYQSWRPDMQFTIWRDGHYLDVKTMLRHHWVKSLLDPYGTSGPTRRRG